MPSAPKRPCTTPGCPNYQPCAKHPKAVFDPRKRKRTRSEQAKQAARAYGPEHDRWAKAVKERDRTCQLRYRGCTGKATIAHHVYPKWAYPELAYDLANGMGVCHSCHEIEEGRKRLKS